MKKYIFMLILSLLMVGCAQPVDDGSLTIMTTLFPQYDISKHIVQDKAKVTLLLPPGVEAHDYEPTPQDIVKLQNSDLFIYTSDHLETYASKMSKEIKNKDNVTINLSTQLELDSEDPHYWLVISNMIEMTNSITEEIVKLDPDNADFYRANRDAYIKDLQAVESELVDLMKYAKRDTIVFAGHFSFDYFASAYGMKYVTPFDSYSPNAEASPQRISKMIEYIREHDIKVVYYEELVDPKLAKMLASETSVELLMLNAEHNVSKEQLDGHTTYSDIMRENIKNLKLGLEYAKDN